MARLDPIEKAQRAAERKATSEAKKRIQTKAVAQRKSEAAAASAEKKRLYTEGVAHRKAERIATALAKATALEEKREKARQIKERTHLKRRKIVHRMVQAAHVPGMDTEELKMAGRKIGTLIFELSFRFMGWKSVEFLATKEEKKLRKEKCSPTDEHIYPRQFDGEFLMCHMQTTGELSFETFCDYMDVFCQTAHVLYHENKTLEKFQTADGFVSPEIAYELAGIEVESVEGCQPFYRLEEVAPLEVLTAFFGRRCDN